MEMILEVNNISKTFYKGNQIIHAVNQVTFHLNKKEILGMVGESGSGKSTIIQLITRFIEVDEGAIFFQSKDITKLKGKKLLPFYQNIQLVFQNPLNSFNPRRTIGSSIIEGMMNQGIRKKEAIKEAKELLNICQLSGDIFTRYPHQVSGGQLQRASIARAISIKPSILICDEATSSLDVTTQKQLLDLLESLRQKYQMAILFICHDLAVVQQFCDRIVVIEKGSIIEQGTPYDLINSPKTKTTKRLIDSILE